MMVVTRIGPWQCVFRNGRSPVPEEGLSRPRLQANPHVHSGLGSVGLAVAAILFLQHALVGDGLGCFEAPPPDDRGVPFPQEITAARESRDNSALPLAAGTRSLITHVKALELAQDVCSDHVRRLERQLAYLNTRYLQKMQVSWSAVDGRWSDTGSRILVPSYPLFGKDRMAWSGYRFPSSGGTRDLPLQRNLAFRMNSGQRIVQQFTRLDILPESIRKDLNRPETGFCSRTPGGDIYARYFDFLVVRPRTLEVVAGFRRDASGPDGVVPLEVWPPEARRTYADLCARLSRHDTTFPAVITRLPLSERLVDHFRDRRKQLLAAGQTPDFWLQADADGVWVLWERNLDAAKYLAGTRHPLRSDPHGFITYRAVDG